MDGTLNLEIINLIVDVSLDIMKMDRSALNVCLLVLLVLVRLHV